MAHPKSRISKQRKRKRRTHYKLTDLPNVVSCSNCGSPKLRHAICSECGSYRGRTIIQSKEEYTEDTDTTVDDVQIEE